MQESQFTDNYVDKEKGAQDLTKVGLSTAGSLAALGGMGSINAEGTPGVGLQGDGSAALSGGKLIDYTLSLDAAVASNPAVSEALGITQAAIANGGGSSGNSKRDDYSASETTADFEKRISKLAPEERVAAVKEKAKEVAQQRGLIKDSKLSKMNGRDIYKDLKTGEYYSVDTQHERFEYLNRKGQHIGEVDFDFNSTKPADVSGKHNINIK